MTESVLRLYVGRDKGKAVIILAPDTANAKTMVDASTQLTHFGFTCALPLSCQGPVDAEAILNAVQELEARAQRTTQPIAHER